MVTSSNKESSSITSVLFIPWQTAVLFRGILVRWRHPWNSRQKNTMTYLFLPILPVLPDGAAGKFVHQCCGTNSNTSPRCRSQGVPGLLWLLRWSYSWTQLEAMRPIRCLVARLLCCSDELGLQDSTAWRYWQLRRSLGWSGSLVQVESCILQNINNRKVLINWCRLHLLHLLTNKTMT